MTMKVFLSFSPSFWTNPRIFVKFQSDRFKTFDENQDDKNSEITTRKPYNLVAATPL